ncbi:MAG TPA: hypothetical protein VFH27_10810 [Longimicrobiaceae bacterium]|nr:hypothetical protein [Longimicrobiaceae bacterium]
MYFSTIVKVVAAEDPTHGIAGIKVALFDRDLVTPDDSLGSGATGEGGEVRFEYTSDQFVDIDDRVGGVMPDLYVVVYDGEGKVVMTTREHVVPNTPLKRITVSVSRALLEQHGLAPTA